MESEDFRVYLSSRVSTPNKQISFNLYSYGGEIEDVSSLGNVNELNLSGCAEISNVSSLGNVHTLDLSFLWGITDVSCLGNVHTLFLLNCSDRCLLVQIVSGYNFPIYSSASLIKRRTGMWRTSNFNSSSQ